MAHWSDPHTVPLYHNRMAWHAFDHQWDFSLHSALREAIYPSNLIKLKLMLRKFRLI